VEAFKQKVDLVSPKPAPGFVEDFKQRFSNIQGPNLGMLRDKGIVGTAQTGMNDLSQRLNQAGTVVGGMVNQGAQAAGNVANKVLYGEHPPAPVQPASIQQPVAVQPQAPAPIARQPMGMVDLGGGSSITTNRPISL